MPLSMIDVQEEPLSHGVYGLQIKNVAYHLRMFLVWALFTCFCDVILYFYLFNTTSHLFNLWFVATSLFLISSCFIITWIINHYKEHLAYDFNTIFQFICLTLGCLLAIGVYILNYELSIMKNIPTPFYSFLLSSLLLSFCYVMAISHLSQKFSYYIFIFLPSSFPIFAISFLFPQNTNEIYSMLFIVWFSLLFFSAYASHKIYNNLDLLNFKNAQLLQQSQSHLVASSTLQLKLQEEIGKTQEIRNELQLNNQLLEQKVKERTFDIKQINDRLENHQANLAFAHETAGIHSWLWNIEKRTVVFSNEQSEQDSKQFDEKEVHFSSYIHLDDLNIYKDLMRKHLRGFTDRFEATYRIKQDGEWLWIQDIGRVIARHPYSKKPLRMVGIHRDIHKEKNDEEQLKLAATVFDQVAQGVFILDKNLCYLEVNPFFEELIGFTQDQLIGKHLFDITVSHQNEINQTQVNVAQQLILNGEYEGEVYEEFLSGKKLTFWAHINAITDDKNKIINYVGILTDLTERIKQEQRLSYLENYDALTDLPNRFYFNLQLHHYITNTAHALKHFAIFRINIDRFRSFNEFLSSHAGDELLKQVSLRLRQSCADALLISYLNNDDFAIIYNLNNSSFTAHLHAKKILKAFKMPFTINGQEQTIAISIGIAVFPEHGRQIESLNSLAELALAEAKNLGGNTFHFYSDHSTQLLNRGINLESDLRKAIKNNELVVFYQPKICLKARRVYGFEALIRWNHPELGLIAPDMFIPLAEETSLITDIGQFVLFETCKQIKIWQELGFDHIRVSVNIVAQQIYRGQLLEDIDAALSQNDVSGHMLELELTESSLLDKTDYVLDLLEQIKQRNILISLDDFGTGYSSLAYLTSYPIDTLKIDKAFISKIGQEKDEAIVHAIIALGKAIGLTLVAEGVETLEQIHFLENRGCYLIQGFYFSKPLTALESTAYLNKYKPVDI